MRRGKADRVDHFEYITMVVSFVSAFAISQLLSGWARQWTYREVQPPYALHTVSTLLFLIALVQSIWGSWAYRDVPWSFGPFLVYFASTLPLAGAAALIHPPIATSEETSIRAHYFSNGRAAYLLIAVWIALAGLLEWLLVDHLGQFSESMALLQGIRFVAAIILTIQSISRSPRVHWVGLGLLAIMISISSMRFGQFTPA
ncbi:MAG: hypothetical protein AAGC67_03700 [Myxococcota bacterium]